jgi:curved DNA-binding protein CbpA
LEVLKTTIATAELELARLFRRYTLHPRSDKGSTAADSGTIVRLSTTRVFASVQETNEFDLYKTLGISSKASASEIKVAFRKLAKKLHPDRNPRDTDAEKRFAAVHEAYTILGNAELRAIYDSEMERIRGNAEAEVAQQGGGSAASRHRRIWHEVAKMAAVTVVLIGCFVTGLSLWQQNSSGLQRNHTALPDFAPLKTQGPLNISKEQLAEALFGSEASRYAEAAAAPGSEPIATRSEPAAVGNDATTASIKTAALGSEAKAASADAAASDSEGVIGRVRAVIEPAPAPTSTEVAIAVEPSPREPATRPTPSKPLDEARREQAERLIGMGDRHLADGNIAIARQYFARAFDLGFAQAAIRVAETYEAQVLARLGAHGIKPNPVEAEKWRRRASDLGQ